MCAVFCWVLSPAITICISGRDRNEKTAGAREVRSFIRSILGLEFKAFVYAITISCSGETIRRIVAILLALQIRMKLLIVQKTEERSRIWIAMQLSELIRITVLLWMLPRKTDYVRKKVPLLNNILKMACSLV